MSFLTKPKSPMDKFQPIPLVISNGSMPCYWLNHSTKGAHMRPFLTNTTLMNQTKPLVGVV
jgi:hypothetical protein